MAIEQVTLYIPDNIKQGLDNGMLVRSGGVVRDLNGKIVTHLKESNVDAEEVKKGLKVAGENIVEFASKHKNILIGTGVLAVITIVGAATAYIVNKDKSKDETANIDLAEELNAALCEYLNSIREKTVSSNIIENVLSVLEKIQKEQNNEKIEITFSVDSFTSLMDLIRDYTEKIALANSFNISNFQCEDNNIQQLKHYLSIQKQVFDNCA